MIRMLTEYDDILKAARVMQGFEQASKLIKVDPVRTAASYHRMVTSGIAVFFVLERDGQIVGGLGAIKCPDLHYDRTVAVESFWFVKPDCRGKGMALFDAFEKWGKQEGCTHLAMIHMMDSYPDRLEKLYERKGYKLWEKHYVKELI